MFKDPADWTTQENLACLSNLYESGAQAKAYAVKTLRSRQSHRSFLRILEEEIEDSYQAWRNSVLSILQASNIPGHIRANFLDTRDSVVTRVGPADDEIDYVSETYRLSLGILHKILEGYTDYVTSKSQRQFTIHNTTINGNVQGSNVNSPNSNTTIQLANTSGLDEETRQLLIQLKDALNKKDKEVIKKIFGYIADKGVDVALQLSLGHFFR